MRVHEEQCQNLSMAWFGFVEESEWVHSMLDKVGECQETTLFGHHVHHVLYSVLFILMPEYGGKPFVVFLFVNYSFSI
jgi:hypothetical protein